MKKFLVFLLFLLLFCFSFKTVFAETIEFEKRYDLPSASDLNASKAACKGGICADNMMNFQLNALAGAGSCLLGGVICGAETSEEQAMYMERSVLGQTSQAIAFLYQERPASTLEYLAWMGSRTGLIPKTYAQGVTFSRLLPILPIWKAFRDIAFVMLAGVMLMIGLMIMFRAKVNPQTVANVENTIPRVIVTIILIWLSFPIASLIIDFMYVLIAATIGIIGTAVKDPNVTQAIQDYSTGGFMTLFAKTLAPVKEFATMGGPGGTVAQVGGIGLIGLLPGINLIAIPIGLVVMVIGGAMAGVQAGDTGAGLMAALSPIFVLIVFVVLFFQIFKIFFILLTAYIQILISIIIAPVYLLANAIPGRNTFTSWWKGIVGNMLSFVVTAVLLYLGWAIASLINTKSFWTPPFIVQGGGMSQMAIGLIALGIVLLIPQAINMVKQALGVKSVFNVGPSMVLGPVTGAGGSAMGLLSQFHTASLGISALKGLSGSLKKGAPAATNS